MYSKTQRNRKEERKKKGIIERGDGKTQRMEEGKKAETRKKNEARKKNKEERRTKNEERKEELKGETERRKE